MKSISFWWQLESIHLLHSFGGCGGETKESGVNPRYHSKQHTKSERLETGNQTLSPALLLSASPQRPAEQKETWTWGRIRALCCVRFEGKKKNPKHFFPSRGTPRITCVTPTLSPRLKASEMIMRWCLKEETMHSSVAGSSKYMETRMLNDGVWFFVGPVPVVPSPHTPAQKLKQLPKVRSPRPLVTVLVPVTQGPLKRVSAAHQCQETH